MDAFFKANREYWNASTPLHLGPGEVYDIEAFRKGASTLLPIERKLLGDLTGQSILHAQCHIGVDSMSLARLGALVTGVDFSEEAIRAARDLNDQCGLNCRFLCCNVYDVASHLHEQFDVVYATYGVLLWLPDLARWCRVLADRLRPGGTFILIDIHPLTYCIEPGQGGAAPHVARSYFTNGQPQFSPADEEGSYDYHATDTPIRKANYEWTYTVSDILNAVADAGLTVQRVGEHPECCCRLSPEMVKGPDGLFRMPAEKAVYPLLLSLKAVKR